ncbi:hypothetical protein COCNU_scaffold000148G000010 [Cocos nucifera]|nr:hypothetical protein [Cocos nucifera]
MDTKATKMLTKELYAHKRKGEVPGGSLKRAKVGAPNSATPTATAIAFEVVTGAKVAPTTKVSTIGVGFMPPTPSNPSSGDHAPELPTEREMGEGKKKKKAVIKMLHKAHPGEPSIDHSELGEDAFDDSKII